MLQYHNPAKISVERTQLFQKSICGKFVEQQIVIMKIKKEIPNPN